MVKHAKAQEKGAGSSLRRRQTLLAWGFALPFAVIFCVFMLIPLISSMAMSFTDITSRDLRTPFNVNFVGLDQYIALFSDKRFLHSLGVTGIFVLIGLPITMIIALAFAVALNKGSQHLNAFFRALFYAPVVASVVARLRCMALHPAGRRPAQLPAFPRRRTGIGLAARDSLCSACPDDHDRLA